MPYPLPAEGPPYSTDLRWFLVAVPDEAAFVQAALGAYTEFTHYWKWGKEGKEPGRNEAAQVWENAVGATLEALEMGFPDILLGYIDGVETLLQTLIDAQCCQTGSPVADLYSDDWATGDAVPQNVVDAGFASSTSDQAGYSEYKCMIANVAVEDLINKVERIAGFIEDETSTLVGGVGAIVSLLAFVLAAPTLGVSAMALGMVVGIGVATDLVQFFVGIGKTGAENLAVDLADAFDDLVCAIYTADGNVAAAAAVSQAIEAATNAEAALELTPLIAGVIDALYAGRYDQTNTAQLLADEGFDTSNYSCSGCTVPFYDYMLSGGFTTGGLRVWDGDSYEIWTPAIPETGTVYRAKATTSAGELCFQFAENASGSPNPNTDHSITIDIAGANGSSIAYTVLDAEGNTVESGNATDNGGFFPRTVTGARFNYTQGGFRYDMYPTYWAEITVNS